MVTFLKALKKDKESTKDIEKISIIKYWHSFVLISFFDKQILFDPYFGKNTPCNFDITDKLDIIVQDIPKLDAIFITHEHFDHFDKEAVEFLAKRDNCPVIAPQIVINQLDIEEHLKRIVKTEDKEKIANIDFSVLPAQHPQSQYPVSFLLRYKDKEIYFAGDTFDQNLDIKPDIAIVPCGGVFTMDLFEFIAFARKTSPKVIIPIHYNTFGLIKTNMDKLKERASEKLKNTQLLILENNVNTKIDV